MKISVIASVIDRLPPGRARARYERLLSETGRDVLAVTVSNTEAPLWIVTGAPQAEALTATGIPRWRVLTLREANSLLEPCGFHALSVAEAARRLTSPLHA